VPKIPSMRITDLAQSIAPECRRETIGIRPGEKLHESLISVDEARHSVELDDMFVIEPEDPSCPFTPYEGRKPADNFYYSSDTNTEWLSIADLQNLAKEFVEPMEDIPPKKEAVPQPIPESPVPLAS